MGQVIGTGQMDLACQTIRASCTPGQTIAFVSGNFNVVHPGHLRLLKFAAEQADVLVVGVNQDSTPGVTFAHDMRLENVRSIAFVHHVVRLETSASDFISHLQPAIVVKGKEFEDRANPEQDAVNAYGGRLIFSSGELRFASLSLLERDANVDISSVRKPQEFPKRHGFEISNLKDLLRKIAGMRVVVIGDLIIDEYVTCDAVGMSQEDPTIVVTPLMARTFVGGAGAVAAHAHGLGAEVNFFTLVGDDEAARFAGNTLEQHGVKLNAFTDQSRPTTRKQRFRAHNKTLLRVNHLRQHASDADLQRQMLTSIERALKTCDLLLFSCFNYGCLPQDLVDAISDHARCEGVMMAADSQVSSQTGDVSRFKGMTLLTPTEREARVALNDFISGLAVISERLVERARTKHLVITLGAEGALINTTTEGTFISDRLPAFNPSPKDVSGAGDSFFMACSMGLRAGADIWQASYLGALAAALQVSRVGNLPLTTAELVREIDETGFSQE
ncbi:PfkB family carbohydrate kinase [Bradyrhizobium sp. HKCCYLS2038]|uniref:PfkB family carbohydrate kinase n=1 Tax=unclassified Bradyrhizobium TaxID=2631580 RepID=UPI003EBEE811